MNVGTSKEGKGAVMGIKKKEMEEGDQERKGGEGKIKRMYIKVMDGREK